MAYSAKILTDSISEWGNRLTTMEVCYPRFVHSEMMTHRQFSRNSASSRAIPVAKMIEAVKNDPAMPVWWGKAQSGMQAREELDADTLGYCKRQWLTARDEAIARAEIMREFGLHKQIANRILEPWMWITVIISSTEWTNFFGLRCHEDAQPEIRHIAEMMQNLHRINTPRPLAKGEWHLPLIQEEDTDCSLDEMRRLSAARCARVSYLTHDGRRDLEADYELHDRLVLSGHWSPFEHQATPSHPAYSEGNFTGWQQYRKLFANECRI